MKKVNILVLDEDGDFYFAPVGFDQRLNKTVILAYRLGELSKNDVEENATNRYVERNHYDSVVRIDQHDIFTISNILARKLIIYTETETNSFIEQA